MWDCTECGGESWYTCHTCGEYVADEAPSMLSVECETCNKIVSTDLEMAIDMLGMGMFTIDCEFAVHILTNVSTQSMMQI